MSIFEYDEEEEKRKLREEEFEYGKEEGRNEGRCEGRNEILSLIQNLLSSGRKDEIERAVTDEAYRKALLEEFGLETDQPLEKTP